MGKITQFFKNAFADMKRSTKEQHEVDKAEFAAVKAEAKANFEEARMSPSAQADLRRAEQAKRIEEANARREAAEARTAHAKDTRK